MPHKKHDDKASMTKPKNLKRQTDGELEEIKKELKEIKKELVDVDNKENNEARGNRVERLEKLIDLLIDQYKKRIDFN